MKSLHHKPAVCHYNMTNLWSLNHPKLFWGCQPDPPDEIWEKAIQASLPILQLDSPPATVDSLLELTLGESRLGPDHWRLSLPKRAYYNLKPFLPRVLTRLLRQLYHRSGTASPDIPWPIDARYADFMRRVLTCVVQASPGQKLLVKAFWPNAHQFAFVLTHDIEGKKGQEFVRAVADLEENMGFRSSFNFVPEKYPIDTALVAELRERGFEIGIHGLKHDGKLFNSYARFMQRAGKINDYLKGFGAVGFRSPLTHRNPEWMQALEIDYDLSFFDTDPFEPIPGGAMTIWPFFIGRFVELPYTLVQDYTLTSILHESTACLWLQKVEFIRRHSGMVLLNSHPDYLANPDNLGIYREFLLAMQKYKDAWHALPHEVSDWWRMRSCGTMQDDVVDFRVVELDEEELTIL